MNVCLRVRGRAARRKGPLLAAVLEECRALLPPPPGISYSGLGLASLVCCLLFLGSCWAR